VGKTRNTFILFTLFGLRLISCHPPNTHLTFVVLDLCEDVLVEYAILLFDVVSFLTAGFTLLA
jgi:hypothetical protein